VSAGKANFDQVVAMGWKRESGKPPTVRRGSLPGEDEVVEIP
jgi:hypothetical protein